MGQFSRATREQIVKRVVKARFTFDQTWKSFICGRTFLGNACLHTETENEAVALAVKQGTLS